MKRSLMGEISGIDGNTLLLLHGNEFNDATGNNVVENFGVTISEGKFHFQNTWLGINFDPSVLGAGDYTVDFLAKIKITSQTYQCLFNAYTRPSNGDFYIDIFQDSDSPFRVQNKITGNSLTFNVPVENRETLNHYAFIRHNGVKKNFFNGVLQNQVSAANVITASGGIFIGHYANGYNENLVDAYISEFRISNVARWTSNFTPPTKPY